MHIHSHHLADNAVRDDLAEGRRRRREAVVESDGDFAAGLLFGAQDRPALLVVNRHRLLADHVLAGLESLDDVLVVEGVLRDDDERVELDLADHPLEVLKGRDRPRQLRVNVIHVDLRRIAQRHEFARIAEVGGDRRSEHPRRAARSPDNRKAFLRHLLILAKEQQLTFATDVTDCHGWTKNQNKGRSWSSGPLKNGGARAKMRSALSRGAVASESLKAFILSG